MDPNGSNTLFSLLDLEESNTILDTEEAGSGAEDGALFLTGLFGAILSIIMAAVFYYLFGFGQFCKWFILIPIPMSLYSSQDLCHRAINNLFVKISRNTRGGFLVAPFLWVEASLVTLRELIKAFSSLVLVVEIYVFFDKPLYTDHRLSPWTFVLCNIIFISSIYCCLTYVGCFGLFYVMQLYRGPQATSRTLMVVEDGISLCLLSINPHNLSVEKRKIYTKRVISLYEESFYHQLVNNVRLLQTLLVDIKVEGLAKGIWQDFLDLCALNAPSNKECRWQWSDYFYLCVGSQLGIRTTTSSSTSLLLSKNVSDEEDLFIKIKLIIAQVNKAAEGAEGQKVLEKQLKRILSIVWILIIAFVVLPMMGFDPNKDLIPLGLSLTPTIVALTVIFGITISNSIQSVSYVLAGHAFEVGDEIQVEGKLYFAVKSVGLLWTTMESLNGIAVYYPNCVLMEKPCVNLTRSNHITIRIELQLSTSINGCSRADGPSYEHLESHIGNKLIKEAPYVKGVAISFSSSQALPFAQTILIRVQYQDAAKTIMVRQVIHKKIAKIIQECYPNGISNLPLMCIDMDCE